MTAETLWHNHYGPTFINVLDHGYVRLVDFMGNDLAISRAARKSYDAAWRAGTDEGSDYKLIRSLMRRMHTTPFEAVEFQFDVKLPIFVWRQWVRHRTWNYLSLNEVSARYKEVRDQFFLPGIDDIGSQSPSSKQARVLGDGTPDHVLSLERADEIELIRQHSEAGFAIYQELIKGEHPWPRELARIVLGLNTYTEMFVKVDLHNLLTFLTLRTHEHAQLETQVYANAIVELVRPIVPVAIEAWEFYKQRWERAVKLLEEEEANATSA